MALRLVDREGRMRRYKTRVHPVAGAVPARVLLVSHDVTDLRESEEQLLLAAHAFEGMTEAIMITAADGTVATVNRAFTGLTGYSRDDVLGQPEKAVRNALQPPEFYDELYTAVVREGYWSGTTWSRRKNGSVYREWRSVRAVRDAGGAVTHYVIVFYEVGRGLKDELLWCRRSKLSGQQSTSQDARCNRQISSTPTTSIKSSIVSGPARPIHRFPNTSA
jgi:PAS domain S-box-containing protein